MPTPAPLPLPWDMVDPEWAYTSDDALLSTALRRSRARVMARDEDDLSAAELDRAMRSGRPVGGSSLWCWAPEFRQRAVQADLASRLQVHGAEVWVVGDVRKATVSSLQIFGLGQGLGFEEYERQIDRVLRAAVEREERLPEILSQASDTWPFFESLTGLSKDDRPRLAELLDVAHEVTIQVLMALKNNIGALRPVQCSTRVVPVIPTPGHGSLPSGHATLAALDAGLLGHLVFDSNTPAHCNRRTQMDRLSRRIAFNRVVAGVHFPLDSLVGHLLGRQMADVLAAFAAQADDVMRWHGPVDDEDLKVFGEGKYGLSENADASWSGTVRPWPALGSVESWAELWRRAAAEVRRIA